MTIRFRAAVLDFDGTLVLRDHASLLAELNGKQAETDKLNADFHAGLLPGVVGLTKSIENMAGLSVATVIEAIESADHLMPGARELMRYLHENDIVTVVASGSILPVLEHYRAILGFDHLVGSAVDISDGVILGPSIERPVLDGFKLRGCQEVLDRLGISWDEVVAIGDSPAERDLFERAALSIAIDPKGNIASYADHVIHGDLNGAIRIIEAARERS